MEAKTKPVKLIVFGDAGAGKTSLVQRARHGAFSPQYKPTIGAQFVTCAVTVRGVRVPLQIWDTAGQEVYRSLVNFYVRDAQAAILVVGLDNPDAANSATAWLEFIRARAAGTAVVLFANKTDLGAPAFDLEELSEWARAHECPYFAGSAMNGQGVSDVFQAVAELAQAQGDDGVVLTTNDLNGQGDRCC
jgi:small GTP-binding protein